mgnify:FL=1
MDKKIPPKKKTPAKKDSAVNTATSALSTLTLGDSNGKITIPVLQYIYPHVLVAGNNPVTEDRLCIDILGFLGIVNEFVDLSVDDTGSYMDLTVTVPEWPLLDPNRLTAEDATMMAGTAKYDAFAKAVELLYKESKETGVYKIEGRIKLLTPCEPTFVEDFPVVCKFSRTCPSQPDAQEEEEEFNNLYSLIQGELVVKAKVLQRRRRPAQQQWELILFSSCFKWRSSRIPWDPKNRHCFLSCIPIFLFMLLVAY